MEDSFRERLRFLAITDEDRARVRDLRPCFAAQAQQFAEKFYQHLLSNPTTAKHLVDPVQLERLKTLQAQYFSELLEGQLTAAYVERRLRVGRTHQRVGLEPVYYLGAYNQYIQLTFPLFAQAFGSNLEQVLPALLSLVKLIFLDIGLALDTYFREATEQLRRRNEELQQALGLYLQAQHREEQMRKLLSHEVRGGLAAIITTLEDLQDVLGPSLDPAAGEQLESVNRRCWSLSELLTEMLASVQSGGPTWVETAQVFEHLAARFGLYAEGRAIQLKLPQAPPRVWADPLQLREVFANLVSNAVRYLDREPGRVEISVRPVIGSHVAGGNITGHEGGPRPAPQRGTSEDSGPGPLEQDPKGDFCLFCVSDNGPGIPTEIRSRLFEPFVRGPTPAGRPEGTGLGLYFVRTIIEQGGGRVWVESSPGQGTRFWFTVPCGPLRRQE
jgi:signal transduction histidine kinase